jgi:hypothetical protein
LSVSELHSTIFAAFHGKTSPFFHIVGIWPTVMITLNNLVINIKQLLFCVSEVLILHFICIRWFFKVQGFNTGINFIKRKCILYDMILNFFNLQGITD